MITDEMVEAAYLAYRKAQDNPMRAALSAALAAMPQEPVAGGRDWPEDRNHENGSYMCRCVQCDNKFTGHKRRVICKVCSASPVQGATAPAVKALIWNDGGFGYLGGPTWVSDTIVGKYLVEQYGGWAVYFNGALLSGKHPTLKDAQAAGQAHFNDAIRSCLTGAVTAPSEEAKPCGKDSPSYHDCPNMKEVGGGFDGERYRCDVCGKGYYLDYEDMK